MAKTKILTDSTSEITKEMAEELNIEVIPLNVFFGDEKFKDRINITPNEFYGMCESGIYDWPTTSQPSAKEFKEKYNQILSNGYDSILSIHISSELSGTLNSVEVAKKELQDKDITSIDVRSTTIQQGVVVEAAAKLLQEGKNKEEVIKKLKEEYIPNSHVVGLVDNLDYLYKGGRIGRAKRFLGKLLNKKPVIKVKDGLVDSLGSVTGEDEAFENLVRLTKNIFDHLLVELVWIGYTDDESKAQKVYDAVKDHPKAPSEIRIVQIGPTVGAHIGLGVMAVSWIGDFKEEWFFGK
jgi:DegV family protein with EDD domain